uniref:Speckle-type POZ protein (inferred by orthology to a human protein) n=1 Tax=Strongyloides venezuelensis TaxID=75913 RepID=A0A0K0F514_STRVS
MVTYLYTGISPNMDKMVLEMFDIEHKYELKQLKSMAEKNLVYSLSIENVCAYLKHSLSRSIETLKEWYLRFIYLNLKDIVNRKEWKVVSKDNPSLISEIVSIEMMQID